MLIDHAHEAVARLLSEWQTSQHGSGEERGQASLAFQKALVREAILPALARFPGELILTYHEFLTREPSGFHSFAFGGEMVSRTVYWVMVGRMQEAATVTETAAIKHGIGPKKIATRVVAPPRFLLPVTWQVQLRPIYRGTSHQPQFVLGNRDREHWADASTPKDGLDLSDLGQHLFSVRQKSTFDRATQIALAIGNDAVAAWLQWHGSADTYATLSER